MKYYVGCLIKGKAADYYKEITTDLAQRFGIKNLSDTKPPHLTFKAPFETEGIETFEKEISEMASRQKVSQFCIKGFSRFDLESKTIFLAIKPDPELQRKANGIVKALMHFGENRKFVPEPLYLHVSIARYLDFELSQKIWAYVATLPAPQFKVAFDNLTLFVNQDNRWEIKSTFSFGE